MAVDSKIRQAIEQQGHITVEEMMRLALSLYRESYYQNKDTLGEEGDFTTAPEISQLFGEIIGLWAIGEWQRLGAPAEIKLLELGPGRGLLMRDLLRTARLNPAFFSAIQEIEFVEINPFFREWQKRNIEDFGIDVKWYDSVSQISKGWTIVIANEFFDALPIRQYLKVKELWYETILIIDPADGKVKFDKISVQKILQEQFLNDYKEAYDGAVLEESPESLDIMQFIGAHLQEYGGAGLVIDYGYDILPVKRWRGAFNSTLQAVKNHRYHTLLENLGGADLSAHVDFYALTRALKGRKIHVDPIISQRNFLLQYGIELRKSLLMKVLSPEDQGVIQRQIDRLISPNQMGYLFKVMTFHS